jgi:hypothetical protein
MDHPFLIVEPEVVLMTADETKTQLTLQVVFKGMDKLSVKFEFNVERDTAEEVVNEMVKNLWSHVYIIFLFKCKFKKFFF